MEIIHHIETARWLAHGKSALEIRGWCFCPDAGVRSVEAQVAGHPIAQATTEERLDVQRHHGGNPHARQSGFSLQLPLLELETVVELRAITATGAPIPFYSVRVGDLPDRGAVVVDYPRWAATLKSLEENLPAQSGARLPSNESGPLVSLVLPVYNTPLRFLTECVESVLQQTYPRWELQLVDDGSTHPELRELLARFAQRDARIRLETSPKNRGISQATNRALALAQGEFVGFIDHDDRLHPAALAEVVRRLRQSGADAAYTDEEKITAEGIPSSGVFKPDFSPEFLCGVMYIGHFLCVRTSVARSLGGFDPVFDGIQDFEFVLRLSEHIAMIEHIPRILYQWRMSPASSALSGNVKGDMDALQAEAVRRHLARIGRRASVEALGAHRVRVLPSPPADGSPTRALIVRHSAGLEKIPGTPFHEISVLREASLPELRAALERSACDRLLWVNEPITAESASALASLPDFLDERSVGAAAPVLLAPDGKVFSSGVIITPAGKLVPAMRGFSARSDGYNGSLACNREVSAVLSACVALRKSDLLKVLSPVAHPFTDTGMAELCLALQRLGLRTVVCGGLRFATPRDWAGHGATGAIGVGAWTDPYYNRHFDADQGDYRLKTPSPRETA